MPFACKQCGLGFSSTAELGAHVNSTHKDRYSCDKCSYKCARHNNLILHLKTHNNPELSFTCSVCSYECTSKAMYETHILTHNDDVNKLKKLQRPRSGSIKRKDSLPSSNVWDKLSLDDLARQHFIDSLVNNEGFSAPCRGGKPIKENDIKNKSNFENKNKQSRNSGVVGTAHGSNLTINNSDRKYRGTVFATRYRADIEISEVKADLERNLRITTGEVHHVDIERLQPKYNSYSSFKITCICNNTAVLMNSDIWPERSFVRWWRNPPKSKGGVTGSSKN